MYVLEESDNFPDELNKSFTEIFGGGKLFMAGFISSAGSSDSDSDFYST